MTSLASHPRLYASPGSLNRLHDIPNKAPFQEALQRLEKINAQCLAGEKLVFGEGHNSLLNRARAMQRRAVSLAAWWWKTRDETLRSSALECVREIGGWKYWSWIMMRQGNSDPNAIFDLSYGENSATLAIIYDWLFDSLSGDERALFREIAARYSFGPFLHKTNPDQWNNFFGRAQSNWNAVCVGGVGMLALAFFDELPQAAKVLLRVEISLEPYMRHLETTSGGWGEGLGYWNYGMRYAFMYLRSWENAHGQEHPLLQLSAAMRTLYFPLDFSPNNCACSFGDAGSWAPLPFHYEMAARYDNHELLAYLDAAWNNDHEAASFPRSSWPDAAEFLIFHPRHKNTAPAPRKNITKLYNGLDWGILADQLPHPSLYAAVRGGNTHGGHSHRDLLSFHCVVGDEKMIENIGLNEYLDSTFSKRRHELFEVSPASKNTLLINGLGIEAESCAPTSIEVYDGQRGIRIDATQAMGATDDDSAVLFCGRVFLMLEAQALLIVDRVETTHPARIEARFHSVAEVYAHPTAATLTGKRQSLQMSFAATQPSLLQTAPVLLTSPLASPYTMLRWTTQTLTPRGVVFATLLTPDDEPQPVTIETENDDSFSVFAGSNHIVHFSSHLLPVMRRALL